MDPLITVIIPTYNREKTICRAIDSVLRQSYKRLELLVVDDCSLDNTVEVVRTYKDERIRLIRLSKNCGANVARNRGIYEAKGEYIAFQDSDDEWMIDKLSIQLEYMINQNKKVCYCPYILHDNNEIRILPRNAEDKEMYENGVVEILKQKNVISTQTIIFHKSIIDKTGIFDETLSRLQDYEFAIRLAHFFEIGYVNQALVNVYREKNCITNNRDALADACKKILIKHISFVDVESLLYRYLGYCEWYGLNEIYWRYLEEIILVLKKKGEEQKIKRIENVKDSMLQWFLYFCNNIKDKRFIIYGAGYYGKELFYSLKKKEISPKCFWITRKTMTSQSEIDGIPILEIPTKLDEQVPVVIAVSKENQKEVIECLLSRNVANYYLYPFG